MINTRTMTPDADMEKMSVGLAFAAINEKGWPVEYDSRDKCWDILTPRGWRCCFSGRDLLAVVRENK